MNTTPTLDDGRIAAMRDDVMHAVDADIARRGRRSRRIGGTVVAAALVLGISATSLQLMDRPGTDDDFAGVTPTIGQTRDDGASPESEPAPSAAIAEDSVAETVAEPPIDADREVITTGSAAVVVDDPRETAGDLSRWIESIGGRIDQRSDSELRSSLTVRVPADQVTATLTELEVYGDVQSSSFQERDVTGQGADLDARIDALQVSVDRLTTILAEAENADQVINAENVLTSRQAELDGLRAQREALSDQVAMSTIEITLTQTRQAESVEPGGFLGGLQTGWNALVSTINGIVNVAGVLAPWLGVALGGALIWMVVRRVRRRNRA